MKLASALSVIMSAWLGVTVVVTSARNAMTVMVAVLGKVAAMATTEVFDTVVDRPGSSAAAVAAAEQRSQHAAYDLSAHG